MHLFGLRKDVGPNSTKEGSVVTATDESQLKLFKGLFGNEKSLVTAGRETGQILITAQVFGQRL